MNNYDAEFYHKQQLLQSAIMRYGITYLDQLEPEDLINLIEQEDRYYE